MRRRSILVALAALALAAPVRAEEAWQRSLRAAQDSLERGALGAAERNINRAIRAIRRVGPEHREVFSELQVLGAVHAQDGRLDKGVRLVERALELAEIAHGITSPALEPYWSMLGTLELQRGENEEAARHLGRSYRVLMGNVSTENAAFREVLRNYAEALRRSGRERDLLLLQSHYGHEVDLGPLDLPPRPAQQPAPRAAPSPKPRAPEPEPEPEPRREERDEELTARERLLQGTTRLPELPREFPPPQPVDQRRARRNLMILNTLQYQIRSGLPAIKRQEDWIRSKLRKYSRHKTYKPELVASVIRSAIQRGGQLALLAQPSTAARKLWPELASEPEQEAAKKLRPRIEEYDRAVESASAALRRLLARLIPKERGKG